MSYDLIFLRVDPAQTWADALAARDAQFDNDDAEETRPADDEVWARFVAATASILTNAEAVRTDRYCELSDGDTGIQVSLYATSADISVPYWSRGNDAFDIVTKLYAVGLAVEEVTGLPGYDPQVELPLAEAARQPMLAAACFDQVAASFARLSTIGP
jgi:hypothetical protein